MSMFDVGAGRTMNAMHIGVGIMLPHTHQGSRVGVGDTDLRLTAAHTEHLGRGVCGSLRWLTCGVAQNVTAGQRLRPFGANA